MLWGSRYARHAICFRVIEHDSLRLAWLIFIFFPIKIVIINVLITFLILIYMFFSSFYHIQISWLIVVFWYRTLSSACFESIEFSSQLNSNTSMKWVYQHIFSDLNQGAELRPIIFNQKSLSLEVVEQVSVVPRHRHIFRKFYIDFFLAPYAQFACLRHRNKMEYFRILCFLLYDLQHDVRLGWFWNLDCVILFIVEVNTVFIVTLTHFTTERGPFDTDTVLGFGQFELFTQPRPQAAQMNVPYRS